MDKRHFGDALPIKIAATEAPSPQRNQSPYNVQIDAIHPAQVLFLSLRPKKFELYSSMSPASAKLK